MNWLSIDFKQVIMQLSHSSFRAERFEAFASSYSKPLQTLVDTTLYQMQHDSRIIYLEKMLNEHFEVPGYDFMNHVGTRTIYIEDADGIEHDYMFNSEEDEVDLYVFNENEQETQWIDVSPGNYYHFIINIPASIVFDELKTRALVDFYKLAGKKYIFQTY